MKGSILLSLGLIMLLLALSCDAAPGRRIRRSRRIRRRPPPWRPRPPPPRPPPRPPRPGPEPEPPACEGVRRRKEFTSLTLSERKSYIAAVKTVSTDKSYQNDYESLLEEHRTLFKTDIHQKKHFLTWHRWFTLQYENLLRRVNPCVTVPYWDWSSDDPFDTSAYAVWSSSETSGFGGDGAGDSHCVQTGPFKESAWSILPIQINPEMDNKVCLAREFGQTPNRADVEDLLSYPAANFTDFEFDLRARLHFRVHQGVGGTMFTDNSAAAPEFFLVHAFVDKLWNDWQKKSEEHKNAFFPEVDQIMPCTKIRPIDVTDLSNLPGGVQVEYESVVAKRRRGQSLIERPSIPRGLDREIIQLFNVSPAEVAKAEGKENFVKPSYDANPYVRLYGR